jgi:hypothetical protein
LLQSLGCGADFDEGGFLHYAPQKASAGAACRLAWSWRGPVQLLENHGEEPRGHRVCARMCAHTGYASGVWFPASFALTVA